jgi:hypothetical protein
MTQAIDHFWTGAGRIGGAGDVFSLPNGRSVENGWGGRTNKTLWSTVATGWQWVASCFIFIFPGGLGTLALDGRSTSLSPRSNVSMSLFDTRGVRER